MITCCTCSKKPTPKPVGSSDPRIREIAALITDWTHLWQAAIPRFQPESLYFAGTGSALRGGYVQPLGNVYPNKEEGDATFEILSANSPDGRYKLVFDWYQTVEEEEGEVGIGGEPDSAPLLLDLREGVSNQFTTCGTPCGFHWGAWISPTRFVLGGWQEIDAAGSLLRGNLSIYSISDSCETFYLTRPVTADEYSRYRGAWEAWVTARFHALKLHAVCDTADLAKRAAGAR
jgi:hypothetical protein